MADKKEESTKVVGWSCMVMAILMMGYSIWSSARGGGVAGGGLLVVGLFLLVVGIVTLGSSKKPRT